jgi:hypothetical protein
MNEKNLEITVGSLVSTLHSLSRRTNRRSRPQLIRAGQEGPGMGIVEMMFASRR